MTTTVARCTHPDCKRDKGEPQYTELGVCEPCQHRVARQLDRVVMDWVCLHATLPAPNKGEKQRGAKVKEYSHPAEWASDTAADIATRLNEAHDSLADTLGQTPPPHPGTSEVVRVRAAYAYLSVRIGDLCRTDYAPDIITEWIDMHAKVRGQLGLSRPRIALPVPCPQCEALTLVKTMDVGRDWVECGNCQTTITERHYRFYSERYFDYVMASDVTPQG